MKENASSKVSAVKDKYVGGQKTDEAKKEE